MVVVSPGAIHFANHHFMCHNTWVCTLNTVESALTSIVDKSEQWNPSLMTIGCSAVLLM